jgi:hypothetical protein
MTSSSGKEAPSSLSATANNFAFGWSLATRLQDKRFLSLREPALYEGVSPP